MFSIEDRQRASSSDVGGRMLFQCQGALRWLAHAELGFGILSKRHGLKGTFGFETHLTLQGTLTTH
jgi:hypothetical protein